jgi:hypothetical protein
MAGVVALGLCSVEQNAFWAQGTEWGLVRKPTLITLFGVIAVFGAGVAHADSLDDPGVLSGSDLAIIVGPTGVGDPNATYITDAEALYLDPTGSAPPELRKIWPSIRHPITFRPIGGRWPKGPDHNSGPRLLPGRI